jgi:hypothetical protein
MTPSSLRSKIIEANMKLIILALIMMGLSGCVVLPTAPSVPMAPPEGKPFDLYLAEDGECRQLAEQRLGRYDDYFSTQEAQHHYDNLFVQCMLSHGNLLVQPPVVYRWYRIPRPHSQEYDAPPPE